MMPAIEAKRTVGERRRHRGIGIHKGFERLRCLSLAGVILSFPFHETLM
jgi:hypothetical protein